MHRSKQAEFDLGLPPTPEAPEKMDMSLKPKSREPLRHSQLEFNKCLTSLEKARKSHDKKRARFDAYTTTCREVLIPLLSEFRNGQFRTIELLFEKGKTWKTGKKRKAALAELIQDNAAVLLDDPIGLDDQQIQRLTEILESYEPTEEEKQAFTEGFEEMRASIESMAAAAGIDLDLAGLDPNGDPEVFEQELEKRLNQAEQNLNGQPAGKPKRKRKPRKPSKASLERQKRQEAIEAAKKRDIKTLYKQLAKALHPDLETDPELQAQKHIWMQRLTSAQADGDLHEMLSIEMEWLGVESNKLQEAADEKLETYALVLKEQAKELRRRTRELRHEPEYALLNRFLTPHGDKFSKREIEFSLSSAVEQTRSDVEILTSGARTARRFMGELADAYLDSSGF